jgi:hypothetical protein
VFHVLSLPKRDEGHAEARGTIRAGNLQAGDTLWFVTPSGQRHEVQVVSVNPGERHVFLDLRGGKESLESLQGGYYLFGG